MYGLPDVQETAGRRIESYFRAAQDQPPPNGEAWPASPLLATTARGPGRERCRSAARLAALQPPSLLVTAAALRHVTGSPGPGLLRRPRPARPVQRSARLSPRSGPDARHRGTAPGGSHVHSGPLSGLGRRPCPTSVATGTHQT